MRNVGPPGRQGEQHGILIVGMDPVLTPVTAVRYEREVLAEQRDVVDGVVQRSCGKVRAHLLGPSEFGDVDDEGKRTGDHICHSCRGSSACAARMPEAQPSSWTLLPK